MAKRKECVIVIHSLFTPDGEPVSGTAAALVDILHTAAIPYTYIQLPIYGGYRIRETVDNGSKREVRHLQKTQRSLISKTFTEGKVILGTLKAHKASVVYMGVDPLNAFWGILGRWLFRNVSEVVYYTADYADNRFPNPVVNGIYHFIDSLCIRFSDQVWNVSTTITERRKRQRVADFKNFFVPNTPVFKKLSLAKRDKYRLIIVGTSLAALDFPSVLDALPQLMKENRKLSLIIVGDLRLPQVWNDKINSFVKNKRVILYGKADHDTAVRLMRESGIGIALYKDWEPWTKYGDSMKIREYLSAGLPVVTNRVVSTEEVIEKYGCGRVIEANPKDFAAAIRLIYEGDTYSIMSRNSLRAAKDFSADTIIRRPLSKLGISV